MRFLIEVSEAIDVKAANTIAIPNTFNGNVAACMFACPRLADRRAVYKAKQLEEKSCETVITASERGQYVSEDQAEGARAHLTNIQAERLALVNGAAAMIIACAQLPEPEC